MTARAGIEKEVSADYTDMTCAETAAMLFWALLASGQITMRTVNGWQTLGEKLAAPVPVDLAA